MSTKERIKKVIESKFRDRYSTAEIELIVEEMDSLAKLLIKLFLNDREKQVSTSA